MSALSNTARRKARLRRRAARTPFGLSLYGVLAPLLDDLECDSFAPNCTITYSFPTIEIANEDLESGIPLDVLVRDALARALRDRLERRLFE